VKGIFIMPCEMHHSQRQLCHISLNVIVIVANFKINTMYESIWTNNAMI